MASDTLNMKNTDTDQIKTIWIDSNSNINVNTWGSVHNTITIMKWRLSVLGNVMVIIIEYELVLVFSCNELTENWQLFIERCHCVVNELNSKLRLYKYVPSDSWFIENINFCCCGRHDDALSGFRLIVVYFFDLMVTSWHVVHSLKNTILSSWHHLVLKWWRHVERDTHASFQDVQTLNSPYYK